MTQDIQKGLTDYHKMLESQGQTMAAHFIECALEVLQDTHLQSSVKPRPRLVVHTNPAHKS